MANERHLLLKASGDYVPNTLPGEIWECTTRLALVFGTLDGLGNLPNNWDPEAFTVHRTETDWTIEGNWRISHGTSIFNADDYLNDQAVTAWTGLLASGHMSNQVRLRSLKLYPCGSPNGQTIPAPPYAQGTPMTLEYTSAYPTGGESSTQLPPQNSIAVGWRTPQVGRRGRGRMFLPPASSASLSGAHVSSGAQTDIADAGKAFLEALYFSSTLSGFTVGPIVTGSPFDKYGLINQVRVGSIVDTQRRRRNRLTESYTTATPSY
jgi:hypothetical protein